MIKKTLKHYVSAIDQHLAKFDINRTRSFSEQFEIDKHQRISSMRDNPKTAQKTESDLFDLDQ